MLAQRRRRWAGFEPMLGRYLVLAGNLHVTEVIILSFRSLIRCCGNNLTVLNSFQIDFVI